MKIRHINLFIFLGILIYILAWAYAFIAANEVWLDSLSNSLGNSICVLIIAIICAAIISRTSLNYELISYLDKYFKNKLSANEKRSVATGIGLIFRKDFDNAKNFFRENNVHNYSAYFISLIDIITDEHTERAVDKLENLREENGITEGFGDLFYLLARGHQKMSSDKAFLYEFLFDQGKKALFAKVPLATKHFPG